MQPGGHCGPTGIQPGGHLLPKPGWPNPGLGPNGEAGFKPGLCFALRPPILV